MASEAARSRCRRRLELLAESGADVDVLRWQAIEELRRSVGFELWGIPLVDPDTLIPSRALVSDEPPWGSQLPRRWVLDQSLREINSRAMLARGREHVGVLSVATGGDLARCSRWREMGKPMGMGDELRAAIVDERGCWGSFELFRSSSDPPFDSDDAELVGDAARILARALRQARVPLTGDRSDGAPGTGVVLIGGDLNPQGVTGAAREWFRLLGAHHHPERTALPLAVFGVLGRLLAAEAGEDPDRKPRARVRASRNCWAMVEGARLEDDGDMIAVSIRAASAEEILPLICRAHGLSPRERELVTLIMQGLDTREIAGRMFISAFTVKDHLKSVFAKLGIRSRRELLARAFGHTA